MKTKTLHFVDFFCISLVSALIWVIVGAPGTARAQNSLPLINQSVLNGLFSPTTGEKFFEEGRREMEREIEMLAHPERYSSEDLLQLNTIDLERIEETGETKPIDKLPEDSFQ
jgi:hypothetical protein